MATTIKKPSDHFNAVLYTGVNPSAASVTTGFEPGIVWIKSRTQTYGHYLYNSVLGGGRWVNPNSTGAEDTSGDAITLSSTGFTTTGSAGATNEAGQGADNLISWVWKTASSNTTNTDGSITTAVRANQTAGVSVVTYAGTDTGSSVTIGHGLGKTPKLWWIKNRNSASGNHTITYNVDGTNYYMFLNSNQAANAQGSPWNTVPSSTVVTLGTNDTNTCNAGENYVGFFFTDIEGFSKIGTYTGNGSTSDGPFIYCGFKPRYVMVKITSGIDAWIIHDATRNAYNPTTRELLASNSVEYADTRFDLLSNGFKVRSPVDTGSVNGNGSTYLYMAFAESPFKYTNAR